MLAKTPSQRPDSSELVRQLITANTPGALLSPRAVRLRRGRRWAGYVAVGLTSAALVAWGVVRVAGGIIGVLMEPGVEPALLVSGVVPDSLAALARVEGSLRNGETPTLAFIPAGHSAIDALLLTDSILIRRSAGGFRRIDVREARFDIARRARTDSTALGFLIVTPPGAPPETLYRNLSSIEAARLTTELGAWGRARRDTTAKTPGIRR
jgi:hypothetical protein